MFICCCCLLFFYLCFFLSRYCIIGARLNIESLLWVEESENYYYSSSGIGTFTTEELATYEYVSQI